MHENEDTRSKQGGLPPDMQLRRTSEGLALVAPGMQLCGDFSHLLPRVRSRRLQRELLVRAVKPKAFGPDSVAVDATAGLGEDAFLLAAAGLRVHLFERDPVIAALLRDALDRARADAELAPIARRMQLEEGDSISALPHLPFAVDVVLLDPMFPAKRKDAASRKKLQMIQRLERPCEDEAALLHAAFAAHPRKVVAKRPAKGPFLAGEKPSYSLAGTTVRYDCYVVACEQTPR